MDGIEGQRFFGVGEGGWHAKGVVLETPPPTSEDALIACGMDYKVVTERLTSERGTVLRNHVATIRDTDGAHLGVVSPEYTVIQNRQMARFFDEALAAGVITYETGGVLHDGRVVWLLGKVAETEVMPGDSIRQFVVLSNAHDGTRASRAAMTDTRVVCANTLSMADRAGGVIYEARHIGDAEGHAKRVEAAAKGFAKALVANADRMEAYRAMAKMQIDAAGLKKFAEMIFSTAAKDENGNPVQVPQDRLVETATELFETLPKTENLPAMAGTVWCAFNAITNILTHAGVASDARAQSKANGILFGSQGAKINLARKLAADIAKGKPLALVTA